MEEQDFRVQIWVIQMLWEVIRYVRLLPLPQANVSICHLIGYLLQLALFSGFLLIQICTQSPNANCSICISHSQELRVLWVEGQTGGSLASPSLWDGGCWLQDLAAQIKYLHHTLKTEMPDMRDVKDGVTHYCLKHIHISPYTHYITNKVDDHLSSILTQFWGFVKHW